MIVEDRSDWWREIADHPEVKPHICLGSELDVMAVVTHPSVLPLRSEHGGFLFAGLDGLGRVYELHTLFTPEGWGREVLSSSKLAFNEIFGRGAQLVTTFEVEGWWRSRPPRSFGFRPLGGFAPSRLGSLQTWILTRDAWEASPARLRMG